MPWRNPKNGSVSAKPLFTSKERRFSSLLSPLQPLPTGTGFYFSHALSPPLVKSTKSKYFTPLLLFFFWRTAEIQPGCTSGLSSPKDTDIYHLLTPKVRQVMQSSVQSCLSHPGGRMGSDKDRDKFEALSRCCL